jgi:hypothetical protein
LGRAVGTRQIRLKMDSTLVRVTNRETTSAKPPVVVSDFVFFENSIRYFCTSLAACGTKLEKMYFCRLALQTSKTGKADSTPNTTIDSGTSANTVVYDSAPAASNKRSPRNRAHTKRRYAPIRARSRTRSLHVFKVSSGSIAEA